ncbi:hypothetical protein ABZ848_35730 [Streptomyces sp. NPDC047081]|uniref:hypothetical protein n=1 Tax=Streptomyces sp. NPDC047081 TaxID=3154706 RepID=UPI0033F2B377
MGETVLDQGAQSLVACWRIDQLTGDEPGYSWDRRSCGEDAKDPRVYDWAAAQLPAVPLFDGDEPRYGGGSWPAGAHLGALGLHLQPQTSNN